MTYRLARQHEDKKKRRWFKTVGFALFVFLIVFVMVRFTYLSTNVIKPLFVFKSEVDELMVQGIVQNKSKKELAEEVLSYRLLEEKFLAEQLRNKVLEEQNKELLDIAGYVDSSKEVAVAAVIVSPRENLYRSLVIDQGEVSGIEKGDRVLSSGVLLGEVVKVERNYSIVSLYASPGKMIEGELSGTFEAISMFGMGGGNYSMSVLRDIEINEGDVVVDRSIDRNTIALVEKVLFEPQDPYKKVLLRSPINPDRVSLVLVLLNSEAYNVPVGIEEDVD